jgi:hypothetical protein
MKDDGFIAILVDSDGNAFGLNAPEWSGRISAEASRS